MGSITRVIWRRKETQQQEATFFGSFWLLCGKWTVTENLETARLGRTLQGFSLAMLQELRGSQTAYLKKDVQLLVSEQKRGVKDEITGTSLVVQWLRFYAPNTGGMGLIPGWGSKIPHASCHSKKKKKNPKTKNETTDSGLFNGGFIYLRKLWDEHV